MRLTQKLLSFLNRVFDKNPDRFLALRIGYDGSISWTLEDGVLRTVVTGGSGQNIQVDVRQYTIVDLAAHILVQPGYTVPFVDVSEKSVLSGHCLMDGAGNLSTSNGDHLYGYTSTLWSFMDSCASELTTARDQIAEMLQQMSTKTADDEWLDEIGSYYAVPRDAGETDAQYGPRIITTVLRPRGNNIAIAMALEEISDGLRANIIDAVDVPIVANYRDGSILFNGAYKHFSGEAEYAYNLFEAQFDVDFVGANGFDGQRIADMINAFRDAGTHLRRISLTGGLVDAADSTLWSDTLASNAAIAGFEDTYESQARLHDGSILRNGIALYDSGSEEFTIVIST